MPDLNLIDDDGLSEELPEGAEEVVDEGGGGGGGGATKVILILLVFLIVLLGGAYLLNSLGIVHLWGNNQPQVMTVEEQFPDEFYDESAFAQQPPDTTWMSEQLPADDVALLETTPLEDAGQQPSGMAAQVEMLPFDEEPVSAPAEANAEPMTSALKDMKGDFTVQVVAYREEEKAQKILSNLEFAGYPAFVEKIEMRGSEWYTVRIGKYVTRAAAREAVTSFASQLRENYFIDKVRSR